MPAIAISEGAERRTRPERILESIKDQKPTDVGRYAGWGADEDLKEPAGKPEPTGPAMMPFLRRRSGDTWWRLSLGFLLLPAMIVVITVEDWLPLSQSIMWISLGVLLAAFVTYILVSDRLGGD